MKNKKINVLIVDDEESILNFLKMGLEAENFIVHCAKDGQEAVNMARELEPDIIILDIMLPKLNGYEACAKIKEFTNIPIIMLTARDDVDDRIMGLDIGADDYMSKPFSYRELVARIRARLRNTDNQKNDKKQDIMNLGKFYVNEAAHEIKYEDNLIELSPTEYKLIKYLLDNNGIVLSKAKILDNVWGYDFYGDENVVEVYIRYLRNKIKDKNHKIIQTVRGVGYKVNIDE